MPILEVTVTAKQLITLPDGNVTEPSVAIRAAIDTEGNKRDLAEIMAEIATHHMLAETALANHIENALGDDDGDGVVNLKLIDPEEPEDQ